MGYRLDLLTHDLQSIDMIKCRLEAYARGWWVTPPCLIRLPEAIGEALPAFDGWLLPEEEGENRIYSAHPSEVLFLTYTII